jgi:hypothetical protein
MTLPLPGKTLHLSSMPAALITDIVPMLNIPSFVMCDCCRDGGEDAGCMHSNNRVALGSTFDQQEL